MYEELYEQYKYHITHLANKYRINGYDFEDIVQEYGIVFINVANNFDETRGEFTTLLDKACKNRMLVIHTHQQTYKMRELLPNNISSLDYMVGLVDNKDPLITLCEGKDYTMPDKLTTIYRELEKLPRGNITIDYYYGGKTLKEVAVKYEISYERVRQLNEKNIERVKLALQ